MAEAGLQAKTRSTTLRRGSRTKPRLAEIARTVAPGAHAVLLLDQAGWHTTRKLVVPANITLMTLPARSPELNPVESGSKYLRKMLIQGARAAMPSLRQSETLLGQWLRGLLARAHANTAVVALAAKMARTVWALLRHGRVYEATAIAA